MGSQIKVGDVSNVHANYDRAALDFTANGQLIVYATAALTPLVNPLRVPKVMNTPVSSCNVTIGL